MDEIKTNIIESCDFCRIQFMYLKSWCGMLCSHSNRYNLKNNKTHASIQEPGNNRCSMFQAQLEYDVDCKVPKEIQIRKFLHSSEQQYPSTPLSILQFIVRYEETCEICFHSV